MVNRQKNKALEIPQSVKNESPNAKVVYLSMKAVLQQSIADSDVKEITLCVSDITDDTAVTDWSVSALRWVNTSTGLLLQGKL